MNTRLLTPEDVKARELRLKSLAEEPDAFGTSYEEYSVRPFEQISNGLIATNEQWVLGAFTVFAATGSGKCGFIAVKMGA